MIEAAIIIKALAALSVLAVVIYFVRTQREIADFDKKERLAKLNALLKRDELLDRYSPDSPEYAEELQQRIDEIRHRQGE